MLVSLLKTANIRRKFIIDFMADFLMRSDSSGMIHWTNMLTPYSCDFKGSRIVFIRLKNISLSVRVFLGSLNPGESIKVISPLVEILTKEVIDVNDFDASKFTGRACLLK